MVKAVHIISSIDPECGGTSVSVQGLAHATAEERRCESTLLYFGRAAASQFTDGRPYSAVRLGASCNELLFSPACRRRLDTAIQACDIVHIHGIWQPHCALAAHICRRRRKPYIVSIHGMLDRWAVRNKYWKKLPYAFLIEKRNLRKAACVRVLTSNEAEDCRRFGVGAPLVLIPNGVERPGATGAQEFLDAFPYLKGKRLILFLGRIHYKKGVDILCRAWARVCASAPGAHLVLAGPDFENTQPGIERLVGELGISGRVSFTGMLGTALKWSALSAASLFTLPSHSEGFSVAVLEALSAGLPVLISRQCWLPEVAERQCGWIVEPDVDDVERGLRSFLSLDMDAKSRISRNAAELARSEYAWGAIGARMLAVYERILGGGGEAWISQPEQREGSRVRAALRTE